MYHLGTWTLKAKYLGRTDTNPRERERETTKRRHGIISHTQRALGGGEGEREREIETERERERQRQRNKNERDRDSQRERERDSVLAVRGINYSIAPGGTVFVW